MPSRLSPNPPSISTARLRAGALVLLGLGLAFSAEHSPTARVLGPCDPPASNLIVCENQNTGSPQSEWDVQGAGDATIQGFATDISVNRGQTVSFKISTNATQYRLDIYRLGYYGGAGARKVATVQPSVSLPQTQPACLTDNATGLVDCGNWSVSASWAVPATAVSGIYIAKAIRLNTGGASHIVFVVRDDAGQSDVLFQTSDTTWHAYNSYGGNSLYEGAPAGRAYKVSYNRPFNNRNFSSGPRESFLFNAEYPMVRWLEANGYSVSYSTGVDTDRRGNELLEHDVFLSVGHDEYWSAAQRANVEAARAGGINLAFFSGNEVFWKTRWQNSLDASNTPYRTLVSYKETHANAKIDPLPNVWTGSWRDARFSPPADGGRPENALTGTLFMVNGTRNDAIAIPAAEGRLRFWRNTSIATLPTGGSALLPAGTLGYEWDVDVENAARPAGLIRMSSTTVDVSPLLLLDNGSTYGNGQATHSLTLYRHASGALVFGAGTVQWSWGLDDIHDRGNAAPDARMQQATVNLLADMGVQPITLQSNLVVAAQTTDSIAPTVVVSSPAQNATVAVGTPIVFSGTAADTGGVVGAIEYSVDGGTSWRPASGRESWTFTTSFGQTGTASVMVRGVDDSGNIQPSPTVRTVTVAPDTQPPVISQVQVASVLNNWATITWSTDELANSQVEYGLTTSYGTLTTLDSNLTQSHVMSLSGLTPNTTYQFRVRSRDASSNLAVSGNFSLTTAATASAQTITFDDLAGQNHLLEGAYPAGIMDWNTNSWWHSSPWGGFTTKSVSFARAGMTAAAAQFITPLRLLRLDAYNGDSAPSTMTLACSGLPTVQTVLQPGQLRTVATGWSQPCTMLTISNSQGWTTNFDNLVFDAPADTAAPIISSVGVSAIAPDRATISWTTNEPANGQVEYGPTTSYGTLSALVTPLTTAHSIEITGLSAGTTYQFRVRSRDAANNLGLSANASFSTNTSGPAISQNQASLVTDTTARISWTTSTPANTQVEYGLTTSYGAVTPLDSALTTAHAAALSGLTQGTTYHYRVKSRDQAGQLTTSADRVFQTKGPGTCPCSLWPLTAGPAIPSRDDVSAVELGVRFRAETDGQITGLRFYKGAANTGTHQANLWRIDGTLLATATFVNETASGWQEAVFDTPVTILANTSYIASYFSPAGGYAVDEGFFATALITPPLQALADNPSEHNGVYRYGSTGFPTSTFNASNYWVDVVYTRVADTTPPVISNTSAVPGATTSSIQWTTNELSDSLVEYGLTTSYGSATTLDPTPVTSHTAQLSGLTSGATYHFRVRSRDAAGNLATSSDFTFTTTTLDTTPPVISSVQATNLTSSSARVSWTTNEAANTQVEYGLTTAYGTMTTLDTAPTTSHIVDVNGLAAGTTYQYRVRSRDAAGNLGLSSNGTFTTAAAAGCPCSLWPLTATPAVLAQNDSNAVELGVRFRADRNGQLTGLRFYKGPGNTGTHVGHLWTDAGTLLATATFVNETATGWQEGTFAAPVAITANTTYVASYFAPNGHYAVSSGYFAAGVDAPPLHAPADGVSGRNGVYAYGPSPSFPAFTFGAGNYWVDVVFSDAADTTPPAFLSIQATHVTAAAARVSWTTNEAANTQVEYGLTTAYGTMTTLDTALTTSHIVDVNGLAAGTTYQYRVLSRDAAGNLGLSSNGTFTTAAAAGCPCSLWPLTATPAVLAQNDSNAIELGVRFRADRNGQLTGLRFYKGAGNTGPHVAHLWTDAGALLATATFANETATGWQEVTFATPVTVTANTTYVASYFAPNGHYAVSAGYFAAGVDTPPLHAPADGVSGRNGVYAYSASPTFPTSTFGAGNYWVDVVFK